MAFPAVGGASLTRRGLLVAAATTLTAAACGQGSDGQDGGGRSSEELIIGVSLELTGAGEALGVLQERALRITLDTLNEQGVPVGNLRRKIRLVAKDNRSDPRTAVQQVTEMIDRDQVHALIGGTLAETSLAILKVAQDKQIPFISLASCDDIVVPLPQRTFIYKVTPDASDVARRLVRLIDEAKVDKVAVLAGAGPYGDSGERAIKTALSGADSQISRTVRLPATGDSFTSAARRVASSNPDAVVIWAIAPDTAAAAQALRAEGFTGRLYLDCGAVAEVTLSNDTVEGSRLTNAQAVEGAYVVHPASMGGSSLTNTSTAELARRDFVFRYIQQHGAFSGFAPYASDAVSLIVNAARLAKSVDRGRLRVYLETLVLEGIAGSYAFAPISHGGMEPDSLAAFVVTNGSWARVS